MWFRIARIRAAAYCIPSASGSRPMKRQRRCSNQRHARNSCSVLGTWLVRRQFANALAANSAHPSRSLGENVTAKRAYSAHSPYVVGRSCALSSPVWICAAYIHTSVLLRLAAFLLRRIIGADLAEGYGNPPRGVHRVLRKDGLPRVWGDAPNLSFSAANRKAPTWRRRRRGRAGFARSAGLPRVWGDARNLSFGAANRKAAP